VTEEFFDLPDTRAGWPPADGPDRAGTGRPARTRGRHAAAPGGPPSPVYSAHDRRVWGVQPPANELFRVSTDPGSGATYSKRHLASIGCAAALIAELLMLPPVVVVIAGEPRRERLLDCLADPVTGRPVLVVRPAAAAARPPEDPSLRQVMDLFVADAVVTRERRLLRDMIEFLALGDRAYHLVGERMVRAGLMSAASRRRLGRTRVIWVAVDASASINAMLRLPRGLVRGWTLNVPDRVLLGVLDAIDLLPRLRREYGAPFPRPADLDLPPELQAVVDATSAVVASEARRR
jgi:Golgi phosphoprotein 3 (GPP34)